MLLNLGLALAAHTLTLERYREDSRDPYSRMARKFVKRSTFFIKGRMNTWDYVKLKGFCMAKENISKMKRDPTVWENILANDTLDKDLISNIHKELT